MRLLLTATLLTLAAAGPALGQSSIGAFIEARQPGVGRSSIETIRCTACRPLAASEAERVARDFKGGMVSEVQSIDGKAVVVRTDNMMGGSPVTTVTSTSVVFGSEAAAARAAKNGAVSSLGDGAMPANIDREAQTAAVEAGPGFAPEGFELRLN